MGAGLRHPFGLALLIASLLLVGIMRFLPGLERWSARAPWVLLLGLLVYTASVIVIHRARPDPSSPAGKPGESPSDVQPSEDFPRLVEEALRQLNNPASLSKSGLSYWLPVTLTATRSQRSSEVMAEPGPLEQAQALREVLVSAIERLKPNEPVQPGAPALLQYHILHEEYVQRKSTANIMASHSIAEATFHRNRRAAVSAVSHHLETQEALLARGQKR